MLKSSGGLTAALACVAPLGHSVGLLDVAFLGETPDHLSQGETRWGRWPAPPGSPSPVQGKVVPTPSPL